MLPEKFDCDDVRALGVVEAEAGRPVETLVPGALLERSDAGDVGHGQLQRLALVRAAFPDDGKGGVFAGFGCRPVVALPVEQLDLQHLLGRERADLVPLDVDRAHVIGLVLQLAIGQLLHLAGDAVAVEQHHHVGLGRQRRGRSERNPCHERRQEHGMCPPAGSVLVHLFLSSGRHRRVRWGGRQSTVHATGIANPFAPAGGSRSPT